MVPGFGGCAAITAYFVESLEITHNHVQKTAYNGIHLVGDGAILKTPQRARTTQ